MAITGTVVAGGREAIVHLTAAGPLGRAAELDAVIDTGFTGHLTLPPATWSAPGRMGTTASLDVYRATVPWAGTERPVRAFATEGTPLLGMALLYGSEVRLRVVEGGSVVIEPLS